MRKIFYLTIVFISASLITNAQIKQGQSLLGGDISFFSLTTKQPAGNNYMTGETSFSLSPSFGKAIKDNLILGFDLTYFYTQSKNVDNVGYQSTSKTNGYGFGIFLREYKPLGKGFSVFTQERLGGSYETNYDAGVLDGRTLNVNLGLSPGVAYAICRRVQIEASFQNVIAVNFAHDKDGVDPDISTNHSISIGTNLSGNALSSLVLGFRFLLGS
jgi:hypothetical protein